MVGQSAGMANAAADGVSVRTLAARHFQPLCCNERVLCVNMMSTTKSGRMLHRLRGGTKAGFQMFNCSTLFRTPVPPTAASCAQVASLAVTTTPPATCGARVA